jgi:hypothetical protein
MQILDFMVDHPAKALALLLILFAAPFAMYRRAFLIPEGFKSIPSDDRGLLVFAIAFLPAALLTNAVEQVWGLLLCTVLPWGIGVATATLPRGLFLAVQFFGVASIEEFVKFFVVHVELRFQGRRPDADAARILRHAQLSVS